MGRWDERLINQESDVPSIESETPVKRVKNYNEYICSEVKPTKYFYRTDF